MAQQAVDVMPEDHPDLAGRLNNLENKLKSCYEHMENMKNLKKIIQMAQQVINIMPEDYLDLAVLLNNLKNKLKS